MDTRSNYIDVWEWGIYLKKNGLKGPAPTVAKKGIRGSTFD
ncbi:hypothetical protein SBA4_1350014 [Candidatus Sulfopaludibacter sp. SbA4]|nr:hypothetical protein SBA4_1350014 [Candidatus Sulfopaludibacter sp. SbA4]